MIGYGPSLSDQGIDPEDAEEPKEPILVKVEFRMVADFYDENGEGNSFEDPTANFRKRMSLDEFLRFDRDLGRLKEKYNYDPYKHLWVIRYLEDICL